MSLSTVGGAAIAGGAGGYRLIRQHQKIAVVSSQSLPTPITMVPITLPMWRATRQLRHHRRVQGHQQRMARCLNKGLERAGLPARDLVLGGL